MEKRSQCAQTIVHRTCVSEKYEPLAHRPTLAADSAKPTMARLREAVKWSPEVSFPCIARLPDTSCHLALTAMLQMMIMRRVRTVQWRKAWQLLRLAQPGPALVRPKHEVVTLCLSDKHTFNLAASAGPLWLHADYYSAGPCQRSWMTLQLPGGPPASPLIRGQGGPSLCERCSSS